MRGEKMEDDELIRKLDKSLEKRKKEGGAFGQFYVFKEPGEKFYGRIVDKTTDRFNRERYVAIQLETKEEFILPSHKVLMSEINNIETKIGDYIVIEYLGKSEKGVYRYVVAKLSDVEKKKDEEEIDEIARDVDEILSEEKVEEQETKEEEVEEKKDILEEASKALKTLFEFYDELPLSEVDYYLNDIKKLNVDSKKVAIELGYEIDEKRKMIVKR